MFRNRELAAAALGVGVLAFTVLGAIAEDQPSSPAAAGAPQAAGEPAAAQDTAVKPDDKPLPDMAMGNPDAPVTIVEYSSLSCPHCAEFHNNVLPQLKAEYIDTGKVRYIVREFPLNDSALAGAVVARCLDPSRYFAFIHLLFSRQADWAFQRGDAITPLKAFAKQAGLPEDKADKCLTDMALQKKILAIRERGDKEGVNATPTLFVNGKPLKGAATMQALAEAMKPYLSTQ